MALGYPCRMALAESSLRGADRVPLDRLPARTIFFDGVCNFCDRSVQWLVAHDPAGRFHFAPLQGATAESLRAHLPGFPRDTDSIVYVDTSGPEPLIAQRSDLALTAPRQLLQGFDACLLELPFELPPLELHLYWHRSSDQDQANIWLREKLLGYINPRPGLNE